jgi:competence ComEA-like helix-hairpin-helix protein
VKPKKKTDSDPTVEPLHGLLVLALVGLLAGLAGSAVQVLTNERGATDLQTGDCVYVVYRDGWCLGTVFRREAASLAEVIGVTDPASADQTPAPMVIPCGSAVHISHDLRLVSYESLSGEQVLCTGRRIDINSAAKKDLLPVPGIGPQLAHRIVEHRNASGGFRTLDELRTIPGIGREKLSGMAPFLTIGNAENRLPASTRPAPPSSP